MNITGNQVVQQLFTYAQSLGVQSASFLSGMEYDNNFDMSNFFNIPIFLTATQTQELTGNMQPLGKLFLLYNIQIY